MSSTSPRLLRAGIAALLGIGAVLVSVPFIWMISGSLKPESEVLDIPPTLWPRELTWDNYVQLFTQLDFGVYLGNSLMVVVLSFVGLLLRAMTGYGFAKFRFPGKGPLYGVVLATMMIPDQVTMIPTYLILNQLGLTNTIPGIVLPGLVSAFNVFLFRQFFTTIPDEMLEAARLDGAGELRIFLQVVLPVSGPILAIQAILTFIASWNSFLWPLIVATDQDRYTLPVGLALLEGQYSSNYGVLMAGAAVMVLPVLVVFVFCQRYVVRGFMMSGLK
ncbi:carbohydrate ABC transporter permease [Dactylosporangium sp. CA-152071]|uniref:carbohydrate ABC transporter permease n=1 Tax=Dactylosporangium sp. CA-152071 TaxID=3239933 RepID=UPI003D906CF9